MGATPTPGPTLGTRRLTPMRHINTVTRGIAEAPASTSPLHPRITAIGKADPDISIIRITAGIVLGKVAQSLPVHAIDERPCHPKTVRLLGRNDLHAKLTAPIRPASILLVAACAIAAGLVEQALPDILPDSMRPIKSDGIRLLNFDDARAADAFDAQHMARNFREAALLDRQRRPSRRERIGQDRIP